MLKFLGSSGIMFVNFKNRSIPLGIRIGSNAQHPIISIPLDLSNVSAIGVYGCGNRDAVAAQAQQKKWENRQAEKNRKVALPGKWDDNPDRYLLELAGVKSYNIGAEAQDFG